MHLQLEVIYTFERFFPSMGVLPILAGRNFKFTAYCTLDY